MKAGPLLCRVEYTYGRNIIDTRYIKSLLQERKGAPMTSQAQGVPRPSKGCA